MSIEIVLIRDARAEVTRIARDVERLTGTPVDDLLITPQAARLVSRPVVDVASRPHPPKV